MAECILMSLTARLFSEDGKRPGAPATADFQVTASPWQLLDSPHNGSKTDFTQCDWLVSTHCCRLLLGRWCLPRSGFCLNRAAGIMAAYGRFSDIGQALLDVLVIDPQLTFARGILSNSISR